MAFGVWVSNELHALIIRGEKVDYVWETVAVETADECSDV